MPNSTASSNSGGSDAGEASSWSIIVTKALGVKNALELSGAAICFVSRSGGLSAVSDFFQTHNMQFTKVPMNSNGEARQAYDAGRCDGYLVESAQAASTLNILNVPNNHRVLPQRIAGATNARRATRPIQPIQSSDESESEVSRGIVKTIQRQLRDARCYTGAIDGDWGGGSNAALRRFADRANVSVPANQVSRQTIMLLAQNRRTKCRRSGSGKAVRTSSGFEAYVVDVQRNDFLWIRSRDSASSRKVRGIPHNGERILVQWCQKRGRAEWCKIQWGSTVGWVNSRFLQNAEGGQ